MAVTPCVMVAADDAAIYAAVEELNRTGLARTVRTEVVDGTRVTHLDVPWQPCRNLPNPRAATRLGLDMRDVRILSLLAEGFRCGEIGNLACRVGILGGTA